VSSGHASTAIGRFGPWVALWAATFFAGVLLMPGFSSFETPSYPTLVALVRDGRLDVAIPAEGVFRRGVDGRVYDDHEIGSVLFAAPIALGAARLAPVGTERFKRIYEFGVGLGVVALSAATVVLLALIAFEVGVPLEFSGWRIALLLLASQYLIYATTPSDVSVATPLVVAASLAWLHAERGRGAGWELAGLAAGLAVAMKLSVAPVLAVLVVLAASSPAASSRGRALAGARLLAGAVPGLAIALWWNGLRTGSPFQTPYPASLHGFVPSGLPEGLAAALVSPNKGLLIYTPVLLLVPLALRHHRRLALLVGGSFLLALVRLAGTVGRSSAGGWGIRYYVPWIPLFLVFLVLAWHREVPRKRWRRVVLGAAILCGGALNVAGIVSNQMYRQQLCGFSEWTTTGMNVCAVRALPGNIARVAGARVPDVVVPGASAANVYASNRLAVWWYAIRYSGTPAAVSWGIAFVLFLGSAAAWFLSSGRAGFPTPFRPVPPSSRQADPPKGAGGSRTAP